MGLSRAVPQKRIHERYSEALQCPDGFTSTLAGAPGSGHCPVHCAGNAAHVHDISSAQPPTADHRRRPAARLRHGGVMPTLAAIGQRGVVFTRHHSVYPTVTRVNASSMSTGSYPERHGLLGNTALPERRCQGESSTPPSAPTWSKIGDGRRAPAHCADAGRNAAAGRQALAGRQFGVERFGIIPEQPHRSPAAPSCTINMPCQNGWGGRR